MEYLLHTQQLIKELIYAVREKDPLKAESIIAQWKKQIINFSSQEHFLSQFRDQRALRIVITPLLELFSGQNYNSWNLYGETLLKYCCRLWDQDDYTTAEFCKITNYKFWP